MGLKKFSGEVVKEGKRVRWPKREVLFASVLTVIIIGAFFALMLSLEDLAGNKLIDILRDAFSIIK